MRIISLFHYDRVYVTDGSMLQRISKHLNHFYLLVILPMYPPKPSSPNSLTNPSGDFSFVHRSDSRHSHWSTHMSLPSGTARRSRVPFRASTVSPMCCTLIAPVYLSRRRLCHRISTPSGRIVRCRSECSVRFHPTWRTQDGEAGVDSHSLPQRVHPRGSLGEWHLQCRAFARSTTVRRERLRLLFGVWLHHSASGSRSSATRCIDVRSCYAVYETF